MPFSLEQLHGADNVATLLNAPPGLAIGVNTVVVLDASAFPPVPFTAALGTDTPNYEEVVVTAVTGTSFTLLAPTTRVHAHGEVVENTIGAEVLDRLAGFATAHSHTGGVDGTTLPVVIADHAALMGVTANQHHPQAHAIGGADHSGSLAHSAIGTVTPDQHHAQSHALGGADHSGQLAHTALTSIGTNTHAQIDTALATGVTNDATAAAHIAATAAHGTTGPVVGTTDSQTLTNKILTQPYIADFSNAQHGHTTGAGGGAIPGVSFATPAIGLGAAASPGAAATAIRSDSTIVAFDATAPSTQAFGDTAVVGVATVTARRDHKHAIPANPTPAFATPAVVLGTAAAAGAAATVIRSDSTIVAFDATVPVAQAFADAAAAGSAAVAARRDHRHGMPADPGSGAWSTWTPVSTTQGVTPTRSNVCYRVFTHGKLVIVEYFSTFTSAGTTNTAILVNLPAALTVAGTIFLNQYVGSGHLRFAATGTWVQVGVIVNSTTQFAFITQNGTALYGTTAGGGGTIANGDILSFIAQYETA